MKYRMVITTVEENKNYDEEKKAAMYGQSYGNAPNRWVENQMLVVALNDEEFAAIKKAALEVIK